MPRFGPVTPGAVWALRRGLSSDMGGPFPPRGLNGLQSFNKWVFGSSWLCLSCLGGDAVGGTGCRCLGASCPGGTVLLPVTGRVRGGFPAAAPASPGGLGGCFRCLGGGGRLLGVGKDAGVGGREAPVVVGGAPGAPGRHTCRRRPPAGRIHSHKPAGEHHPPRWFRPRRSRLLANPCG